MDEIASVNIVFICFFLGIIIIIIWKTESWKYLIF